jgi:hypothetical protein
MLPTMIIAVATNSAVRIRFLIDGLMKIVLPLLFCRSFCIWHVAWSEGAAHIPGTSASPTTVPCTSRRTYALGV